MGLILSRVRKKKSAVETLEKLDNDIKQLEENRSNAQMRHKRLTKLLVVYSLGLYVLCGLFLYFQFTATIKVKLLYLVPLAISPLLLYIIKRLISWYYVRQINRNQKKLLEMKKEKEKILDDVMNKETYKVAKEILEKFSSDTRPKLNQQLLLNKSTDELRKRAVSLPNSPRPASPKRPMRNAGMNQPPWPNSTPMGNMGMQSRGSFGPTPPRMFAPILPLNRSYVDRVVEYLIGDGPNNRYALICSQCHSHNGMALKEEFEYIGFKCCYCHHFNPARKMRPEAPKLDLSLGVHKESDSDSDSKNSIENSESEFKQSTKEADELGEDSNEEVKNIVNLNKDEIKSEFEEKEKELIEELNSLKPEELGSNKEKSQNDAANCDEPLLKS